MCCFHGFLPPLAKHVLAPFQHTAAGPDLFLHCHLSQLLGRRQPVIDLHRQDRNFAAPMKTRKIDDQCGADEATPLLRLPQKTEAQKTGAGILVVPQRGNFNPIGSLGRASSGNILFRTCPVWARVPRSALAMMSLMMYAAFQRSTTCKHLICVPWKS